MERHGGQQSDPGDPDAGSVECVVEEFRIVIEGLAPDEDQQVASQVAGEKQDKRQTGEGDDEFLADRGTPIGAKAAGEGVHEEKWRQTAGPNKPDMI